MNCFRHPTNVAAAFCKGCGKPLCAECCRQTFGNQKHVCSEDCARIADLKPDSEEERETVFQTVCGAVFLTVLLAVLGGGLCVWGAKSAIAREESYLRNERMASDRHKHANLFTIFHTLGITDWRAQFGIGAAIGAGSAALFTANYLRNKKAGRDTEP